MDEKRAIELISELQAKVNKLTEERNNYASMLINYEAFLKQIPRSLPGNLNPDSMTPQEWLDWALEQLGYSEETRTF